MWLQVGVYVKVVMQAIDANKSLQGKHIMKKGLQHEQKDAACTTDIVWLSVAEYVNREVQHEQQLQSDSRLECVNNGCSINTNCSVTKICCVNTGLQYEQHLQHKGAVWQQWVAVITTVSMWLQVVVYVKIVMQCDYILHRTSKDMCQQ